MSSLPHLLFLSTKLLHAVKIKHNKFIAIEALIVGLFSPLPLLLNEINRFSRRKFYECNLTNNLLQNRKVHIEIKSNLVIAEKCDICEIQIFYFAYVYQKTRFFALITSMITQVSTFQVD